MVDAFQNALSEVRARKALIRQQRAQLDAEYAQLDATEIGLQNALGQQVQNEIAWTNLVLAVLNKYPGRPMTAVEIRDELVSWGYNFQGVRNPLALINTCSQRLSEQEKIVRSERGRPFRFSCE